MGLSPRVYLAIAFAAACGSDPAAPDSMPDAAPRCDPSTPFAAPVPVDGLNSTLDDVSARLTPDELTVVLSRRQTTDVYDLFTASRDARDAAFGTPTLLATVNSINSDVWPTLSPDGLTLMFDSDRGTPGTYRIYTSKRTTMTAPFATAMAVPELMTKDVNASLANEHALYFNSIMRVGAGLADIWRVSVNPDGSLGTPAALIGGVNSVDDDVTAALTQDELRIFFRRTIAAEPDIFTASRSTTNDGWGAATPVPGLSVVGVNEVPTWISPDGCNLYLYSNATGGTGGTDIYVARRGEP